jgi:Ser/Thr protein kinase RdoA (MazF antagonist)
MAHAQGFLGDWLLIPERSKPAWWTLTTLAVIVVGIVAEMEYIYQKWIGHGDLHPGNIFLDAKHCVLLSDVQ